MTKREVDERRAPIPDAKRGFAIRAGLMNVGSQSGTSSNIPATLKKGYASGEREVGSSYHLC